MVELEFEPDCLASSVELSSRGVRIKADKPQGMSQEVTAPLLLHPTGQSQSQDQLWTCWKKLST